MRRSVVSAIAVVGILSTAPTAWPDGGGRGSGRGGGASRVEWRTLDGSANNVAHPDWGRAGMPYRRVAPAAYPDGVGQMEGGPAPRYISNRIFNDTGQNIFSEHRMSQWGWLWGQFLDHTFGLRDERPGERAPIAFDNADPLERFRNALGVIDFARTPTAPGTGTGLAAPREQVNTVGSYIDAFAVYGGTDARLEWLRHGPVNGTLADNGAALILPGGYLPRANARGDVSSSPPMDLSGALTGRPARAFVAGDARANENVALTAVHTLFAREHNRIVALLPRRLSAELRFQIARRVVGAEEQYVTYTEFLPAMGVRLPPYGGYDPNVDATLTNEFATVGFRAHSMVHGEMEPQGRAGTWSRARLRGFRAQGIVVERQGGNVKLTLPLALTLHNPDMLRRIGVGALLRGLAAQPQYRNDEQIDDSLRSILFQVPKPGSPNAGACGLPRVDPGCFSVVQDLGAIDIQRSRDHGIPRYNALRAAYGLALKPSYGAITGEAAARFPSAPQLSASNAIDDPHILDFTRLADRNGKAVRRGTQAAQEDVVTARRRTPLSARLEAIYGAGNVDGVDAFVGMVSEPHVAGSELGELQLAMWRRQFQALRDGDRFFYLNDAVLTAIRRRFGIDYRQSLSSIIRANTGVAVQRDVFHVPAEAASAAPSKHARPTRRPAPAAQRRRHGARAPHHTQRRGD